MKTQLKIFLVQNLLCLLFWVTALPILHWLEVPRPSNGWLFLIGLVVGLLLGFPAEKLVKTWEKKHDSHSQD